MDFIVDIQGFRDVYGRFLPKEVALVALENSYFSHWVVQPPYPFTDLSGKECAVNNYVTCYHHGIDWFGGDITLHQLATNLREIARHAHRIITRGREKAKYLQDITSREIMNSEEVDCPVFAKLDRSKEYCFFHGAKKEEFYAYAPNNVIRLKNWMNSRRITGDCHKAYPQNNKTSRSSTRDSPLPIVSEHQSHASNSPESPVDDRAPSSSTLVSVDQEPTYATVVDTFGSMIVSDTEDEHHSNSGCTAGASKRNSRGFCRGSNPSCLNSTNNHRCKHR
ncbi:uncharacterized protein LOC125500952 isoform X1 [Athalia rosae]|uniref:uncharacterized protein LOC125500952 isoform X1 n=1 Tax=Athalia rosae TaxID=37344 RepID=UPI002034456F|nr:uncharacterized protein LOC125500952 isoform X1 [Athalia rosae]